MSAGARQLRLRACCRSMMTHACTVNVAARHPAWRSESIAIGLGWEPYSAWSVGDARVTPAGTPLPGHRDDTMCSFRSLHDDDLVTAAVVATVEHLLSRKGFVEELRATGGTLALNIRLNGRRNTNVDLDPDTLRSIASLGMRFSVECFPEG